MSINEMDSKIKELRELRRMADELAAEMETIQDSIKAHMDAEGVDTINGTDWKVTYKAVTSSRLDANALTLSIIYPSPQGDFVSQPELTQPYP